MLAYAIDTHESVKALKKSGMDEQVADAVVGVLKNVVTEHVATKADIEKFQWENKANLEKFQQSTAVQFKEVHTRIDNLEKRMDDRFESLEKRMDDRFESNEKTMATKLELKNMVIFLFLSMLSMSGIVVAILGYLIKAT